MADKPRRKVSQTLVKELVDDVNLTAEKPILERLALPIVWERLPCGVRIQDLQPGRYTDVLSIIMDHYFEDEPMLHAVGMTDDDDSQDEYLRLVNIWLKDTQSLVAVTEGEATRVVGVLIGRTMDRFAHLRTYSRVSENNDLEIKEATSAEVGCLYCQSSPLQSSIQSAKEEKKEVAVEESVPFISLKPNEVHRSMQEESFQKITEGSVGSEHKILKKQLRGVSSHKKTRHSVPRLSPSQKSQSAPQQPQPSPRMYSSRFKGAMFDDIETVYSGDSLHKVQDLRMYMSKHVDIFEIYNVDVYHRVYLWLVIPEYRNLGIGKALMKSAIDVARNMGVEVICGQMTSRVSQNIAHKMGFVVEGEMLYSQWVRNDEEVFRDVTTGNHSLAVMALRIPLIGAEDGGLDADLFNPPGRKSRRKIK